MHKIKLKNLFTTISKGSTPKNIRNYGYNINEIKFLRVSDIDSSYIEDTEYTLPDTIIESNRMRLVPKDSIVVTIEGTIGKVAILKEAMVMNQAVAFLTDLKDGVCLEYLMYLLTIYFDNYIGVGSTRPSIRLNDLSNIEVNLHPLEEQRKIASVLSALDNQIELNNKINQALEGLAQTLYNYWFIQFEFPNEEGRPYKSSGGKMVWNEELKREIPEGWEVKSLSEIADFTNGLAMQKYRSSDGFASLPVIKIKEMKNGITSETERCKLDIPEKLVVKSGDILFSWSASLEVMMWTGEDGGLNQHIYKVVPKLDSKSFCYATLKNYLEYFRMIALSRKTTMGHITRDHLENSFIAIPCEDVLTKFTDFTDVCLQQIISIEEQNQELAQLRNYLLPLLMNGQVGFSDEVK